MPARVGGDPSAPDTLVAQIDAQTTDPFVRQAMRFGALLEGGGWTGPWSVGDSGSSFGPYQIHLPAHPGVTADQAQDPGFAVGFMLPSYAHAVAAEHGHRWDVNAAEAAVYAAERPAQPYWDTQGATSVNQKWTRTLTGDPTGGVAGAGPATGSTVSTGGAHPAGWWNPAGGIVGDVGGAIGGAAGAAGGAVKGLAGDVGSGITGALSSAFDHILAPIESLMIRGLLVITGIALLFVAIHLLGEAQQGNPPSLPSFGSQDNDEDEDEHESPRRQSIQRGEVRKGSVRKEGGGMEADAADVAAV